MYAITKLRQFIKRFLPLTLNFLAFFLSKYLFIAISKLEAFIFQSFMLSWIPKAVIIYFMIDAKTLIRPTQVGSVAP